MSRKEQLVSEADLEAIVQPKSATTDRSVAQQEEAQLSATSANVTPPDAEILDMMHKVQKEKIALEQFASNVQAEKARAEVELDRQRNNLDRERAIVEGMRQDIASRKEYSIKIFYLVSAWLASVLAITTLNGILTLSISEAIILALIGSTTLNVIGLFLVVANYLFPKTTKPTSSIISDPQSQ